MSLFEVAARPIPATRILVREMDPRTHDAIVINDIDHVAIRATFVDGQLPPNFDPESYTEHLPSSTSRQWRAWRAEGFHTGEIGDYSGLVLFTDSEPEPDAFDACG